MPNSNGRFDYPQVGWSVGKMRKRGEKINNDDEQPYQLAMDVRRGQPDIGGWTAEAEKLAGAGIGARGGISPDVIQQQKSAIQAFGQQWQLGTIDYKRFSKELKTRGWNIAWDVIDPTGRARANI